MATKKEITGRWSAGVGREVLDCLSTLVPPLSAIGHGHSIEEVVRLLERLPYCEEVAGCRDLRGLPGGFFRDLDLSYFDFSYSRDVDFVDCVLDHARFDRASLYGLIGGRLSGASFRGARLQGCKLTGAEARGALFDGATATDCRFDDADFSGASFKDAKLVGTLFNRSNLIGCNFRGADLREAVWREVRIDKTTDLRGANLTNLYNGDQRDRTGRLVRRGTDWRLGTSDETTLSGSDPTALAVEVIDAALAILASRATSQAATLRARLNGLKRELQCRFDNLWMDTLLASTPEADRGFVQDVLEQAMRSLL